MRVLSSFYERSFLDLILNIVARVEFLTYLEEQFLEESIHLRILLERGGGSEEASKLIMKRFPWFMCSPRYMKWSLSLMGLRYFGDGHEDRLTVFFSDVRKANYDNLCCFNPSPSSDLHRSIRMLHGDNWFKSFVELVEFLPIAVYITTADEAAGYPVIYANAHVESLCGHPRSEILGQKCRFFASHPLHEIDDFIRLRNAILLSIPARVNVPCRRRDNVEVPSTLFCKPIYGMSNKYRFVVTVHSDVLSDDRLNIMGDFLSVIPNLVNDLT